MENIKTCSIKSLANMAGVKSLSEDCHDLIREIMEEKLKDIISTSHSIMIDDGSKTISTSHVYLALELKGQQTTC